VIIASVIPTFFVYIPLTSLEPFAESWHIQDVPSHWGSATGESITHMTDLNDSLDHLFAGDTGAARTSDRPAAQEYIAKTTAPGYVQKCWKCRGTGQTRWGACFACKGQGGKTFKTSPEARAKATEQRVERKVRRTQDAWQDFAAQNKPIAEWITTNRHSFDFAAKMAEAVIRFGDLTEGQRAAVERCIAREVAKAAAKAERIQQAPQVDTAGIDRLKAAFDQAVAYSAANGLKLSPRITVDGITISPAKAHSTNPGALYVKERAGEYLGKIVDGRFFAVASCGPVTKAKVLGFIENPAEAAKVYGQTTGTCCICNATLRSEWKHKGIGPICAEKFGWA